MEICVLLTNNHGGFNVVGWYKTFFINNKSIIAARNINGSSGNPGNNNNDEK